jgi:DNA-binding NtrC family response regulator
MANELIMVVDDEVGMCQYLEKLLGDNGYRVVVASDGSRALEIAGKQLPDLAMVDLKMPKMNGLQLMGKFKKIHPEIIVIIMTAYGTMESAIKAMKLGAYDYINKPFEMDEILLVINKALEKKKLEEENITLHKELQKSYSFEDIISQDYQMHKIFDLVRRIADAKGTVLIQGETGTGKELIARAIHNLGVRRNKPFIPVDCGALTETLLESELFGHVKGAFTGATSDKQGLFEVAEAGTAFLDEIGHVSLGIQAKLLRVIQDGQIKRVGEATSRQVDVRIISATNENLEKAVKDGRFREDLYYRLNVVPIWIPPLRERKEDIPILVEHFVHKYNYLEKKDLQGVSTDALNILMAYEWPGNVRELENFIHRAVVMEVGPKILPKDLPANIGIPQTAERRDLPTRTLNFRKARKKAIEFFEKRFLLEALQRNNGNVSNTAKEIGLDRRNLQRKCKSYNINPKDAFHFKQ